MWKRPVLAVLMLAGLIGIVPPGALAKITRLDITAKQADGSYRAGEYVRWEGRIRGELSPTAEAIPDLARPARNAHGMVEYSARILLFMPVAGGNGALLVDVPNRGKAYARALYNSPRGLPFQSGNLSQGTGFLEDHGFMFAEVYWELGQGADLPSFADAAGKTRFVEARPALSKAWGSPSCAMPPTSWHMTRQTPRERPTRWPGKSTACWPAANRRRDGSSRPFC
jgi:hypothetical protein